MRLPFARARDACTTCGAALARGAAWCGGCGARVGVAPAATSPDGEDEPVEAGPPPVPRRRRAVGVLALLGLVAGVVAVAALQAPAPVALLGSTAAGTGMSASGPPPTGLQRAWELPLPGETGVGRDVQDRELVVRGDRVAVDGAVVDVERGVVVGSRPLALAVGTDGTAAYLDAGAVLRLDVVDGAVLGRQPLPALPVVWDEAAVRAGEVTVVLGRSTSDDRPTTVLLRDDGTLLAQHAGRPVRTLDRAASTPAAVPVRQGPGPTAGIVLVSTRDGDELAVLPGGAPQVVDVVGDRALVATTASTDVGEPGTGLVWSVRLLDAADGSTLWRTRIVSAVAPRLLGRSGDEGAVLVTRSGREVGVYRIEETADDGLQALAQLRTNVLRSGGVVDDPVGLGVTSMLGAVALDGDVVVLHDAAADDLRAVSADGEELWRRPAPTAAVIAAGGGVVALRPRDAEEPVQLLRTSDGSVLAEVADVGATREPLQAPVAVLGGDLAVGSPAGTSTLDVSMTSATWVDVATGARRTVEEVVAERVGSDEPVGGGWRLLGVVGEEGEAPTTPVVLRDLGGDVVQLLEPRVGFVPVDLDLPDEGDVATFRPWVVGVTARHVALRTESFAGPTAGATHVVSPDGTSAVHLPGVVGLALRAQLLLGLVVDDDGEPRALVGHDPVTGDRRWEQAPPSGRGLVSAIDDHLVLQASSTTVAAVRLEDGATVWTHDAGTVLERPIVLAPSAAVVVTVAGEVVALDRDDGTVRWRTPLGVRVTSMTGAGDDVLLGTADGRVVHLAADGREVQQVEVGDRPVRAVAALGRTVVAVVDGRAVGLRADGDGLVPADRVRLP